ncbi:transposase, partial [Mycobacterium avium]|uniref:transposase n=1 Tax=Mycobacterium avium TaxID=1764 RepID=UPI000A4A937F
GASPHERTETRSNQRNGSRPRTLSTVAGDLELRIPKLRTGSFFPALLERRRRVDQCLFAVVMEAYLHGTSSKADWSRAIAMFLSVVILGRFTTETHAMALLRQGPTRRHHLHHSPGRSLYALACVLYEALTGAKPFPVHSAEQAIRAHLSSPPPRPSAVNPHVPASFDDVIARGMAKHPDDRYGSAGALGRAAKRALAPDPATSAGINTLLAPQYVSAPSSYPPFAAQYPYPATGPVSATDADQGGSKKLMVLTIVGVAVALLVGGTGLVIGLTTQRNSSTSEPSTSPLVSYTNPVPTYETEPPPSGTEPARLPSTPTSAPQDATQQLHQIANDDRAFVRAQLADRWVPQLSSKRPGVVDNGVVWDNAMTLREHLQLRQRYPNVKLLWSGDWSTFSGPDFWVTVAGLTFADSSGPLAWCRFQGFDRDHCAAKLVSEELSRPVDWGVSGDLRFG